MSQLKQEAAEKPLPEAEPGRAVARPKGRLEWVDIAKGIGMVLVIVGHLPPFQYQPVHEIIYWFHMPLFFFLSGFLMKPTANLGQTVLKRVRQLGIPYFCYLLVLEAPKYWSLVHEPGNRMDKLWDIALDFVWGGSRLRGPTLIFWFVPVLLMCSIIGYFLLDAKRPAKLYIGTAISVVVAVIWAPYLRFVQLPFDIGTVPYALSFLLLGCIFKEVPNRTRAGASAVGSLAFVVAVSFCLAGRLHFDVDMKYCKFDMPLLGLVVGLAGVLAVVLVSLPMGTVPALARSLGHVGRKSLTIMYLHGLFVLTLFYKFRPLGDTANKALLTVHLIVLVLIGIALPLLADALFQRFALTRKLFLTT